ncbi:PAS domain-containing protein [Dongia sedimenti]|uniref:PAS domain-containing protein n=1 Tax=Dongia sedimenti TaxID=3064282 RepID=A0ABU0YM37_9PROT|nr:PAS domain-containing protein [Rhodospirillaceae bacterium R-7]
MPVGHGISPPMSFGIFFDSIQSEALRVLAAQWAAVRGDRRMPAFRDIDPVGIGRHLRYVWAWKYDRAADGFTGRLAGEEIDRAFGKSLRGAKMAEFYTPDVYAIVFPRHRRVVTEPAFFHGTGMVFARMGYTMGGERIAMPLSEDGSAGDGILGGTYYTALPQATDDRPPGLDFTREQVAFFPLDPA